MDIIPTESPGILTVFGNKTCDTSDVSTYGVECMVTLGWNGNRLLEFFSSKDIDTNFLLYEATTIVFICVDCKFTNLDHGLKFASNGLLSC